MTFMIAVDKVQGGFEIRVENSENTVEKAVASTYRQAGLRAGELVRKLVEAEFVKVANP